MYSILEKRYRYYDDDCYYSSNRDCTNRWNSWGRWVLFAGIVVFVLLLFFFFSCFTARRRRKRGVAPYRGTGWLAPQHGPVNYYGPGGPNAQPQYQQSQYQEAAPAYNNASNAGYYGNAPVEMQPPLNTYQPPGQGAQGIYQPPMGPPPGKDGIIR